MNRTVQTTEARGTPGFEFEAARVLGRLRASVARLVERVPGGMEKAADLRRMMDLDAALAWQIHTLATAEDLLRAGRLVPKAGAMERFFRSARSLTGGAALVEEAQEAYGSFETLVREHAGDRETFDAMLCAMRPDDAGAMQRIRRTAFKANAATWGVAVRCLLNCVVFYQRPSGEHDCLSIRGRLGVRSLHEGAVLNIYASGRTWGGGTYPPEGTPRVAIDACEVLEEHCSRPTPPVERVEMADGSVRDFLRLGGPGRTGEVSLLWRNVSLDFPDGTTEPPHGCSAPCLEPAEVSVQDLLVPRGWTDPAAVDAIVTAVNAPGMPGGSPWARALPFEGRAEYLGTRLERLYTRHVARYPELVSAELARMGWAEDGFDLYRCVVRYPVLHAASHLFVGGGTG